MDAALNWIWQGSVVAVALAVALRLLDRARASVRSALCWVALLLVVLLPVVSWLTARAPRPARLAELSEAAVAVPDAWWTSAAVMLAAWAAWAGVQAVGLVRALIALRRARALRRPFPSQVEAGLRHWSDLRHRGRRPALSLSDSVNAAAVLGCGRPVIVVAPRLVESLDASELDRVLIHEWAHVQRRDDLAQLLQVVIRIVAGWHPAVWWIDRRLHLEREIACDETTVAITGSPKSYAECLVKLAELRGGERTPLAAPAILRVPGLRARVTKIVSGRSFIHPMWSRGIAAGVLSMLCVVSMAVAGVKLVEPTVLVIPVESIPLLGALSPVVAAPQTRAEVAPAISEDELRVERPRPARAELVSAGAEQRPAAPTPTPQALPAPPQQDAPVPQPITAAEPEPATVSDTLPADAPAPVHSVPAVVPGEAARAREKTPWAAAAEGGTALGRTSKDAGVATAGFFTRMAKRVAGSF